MVVQLAVLKVDRMAVLRAESLVRTKAALMALRWVVMMESNSVARWAVKKAVDSADLSDFLMVGTMVASTADLMVCVTAALMVIHWAVSWASSLADNWAGK